MGKILTYEDIEAKGGHVSKLRLPDDSGSWVTYEGDTHCPSAKDWDLRVHNVKNPYDQSSTRCTDTIDTSNSYYPVYFGYGCNDSAIKCTSLSVTFENGCNYPIFYNANNGTAKDIIFTIGTTGYPQFENFSFCGFSPQQRLYYHDSSFYKIASMTVTLSKAVSGNVQLYSGIYSGTFYKLYNFDRRRPVASLVNNVTSLTVEDITIPYFNAGDQSFLIFIGLTQDFT